MSLKTIFQRIGEAAANSRLATVIPGSVTSSFLISSETAKSSVANDTSEDMVWGDASCYGMHVPKEKVVTEEGFGQIAPEFLQQ